MRVPVRAQISSRWCQSLELRASRETSSPSTSPTWPRPTSATSRWKPARSAADLPDWPRFLVDDDDALGGPAQRQGTLAQGVLPGGALGVGHHLLHRTLPDVQAGQALQLPG